MEATLENTLVKRLRGLDVRKVFLFGSHAWGRPGMDSDIDLLVVLDEEDTPEDATERAKLHQRVARQLRDVERDVPIDLIVHTRPMYRKFLERGNPRLPAACSPGRFKRRDEFSMRKATEDWLASAQDDLETVEELIDNHQLTHIVVFHTRNKATDP